MPNDDLDMVVVGLLNELIALKKADAAAHKRITETDDKAQQGIANIVATADALRDDLINLIPRIIALEATPSSRAFYYITDAGNIFTGIGEGYPSRDSNTMAAFLSGNTDCVEISINAARAMNWPLE